MKRITLLILTGFSLAVASCTEHMYHSPNPVFERHVWKKEGATELEIAKALLECGLRPGAIIGRAGDQFVNNLDGYDYAGPSEKGHVFPTLTRYTESLLCMQASGFTSTVDSYNYYCDVFSRNASVGKVYLAPCQPGAVPRARSVERRLNSRYCTGYYEKYGKHRPECQPGPNEHKLLAPTPLQRNIWTKKGASEVEILKALLECDLLPNVMVGHHNSKNEYVTLLLCMEASGFTSTRGSHYFCTNYANNPYNIAVGETYLAACQPGTVPAARSVERRLDGWYCKRQRYANNPECQP